MSNDSNHASIGGERERAGLGWSARADSWDQSKDGAPAAPATPAAPGTTEVDKGGSEELFGGFEPHEIASWRKLIADGIRTLDDFKAAYNLTAEEIAALQAPAQKPAAKQTVEQELAALRELRRTDPATYWSKEAQDRELALLEARAKGQQQVEVEKPTEGKETTEAPSILETPELAKLDAELVRIAEARKTAKGDALDKLDARERDVLMEVEAKEADYYLGADIAPEVLSRWREGQGVEVGFRNLVHSVGEIKGLVGAKLQDFVASLSTLSAATRTAFCDHLSVSGGDLNSKINAALRTLDAADRVAAEKWLGRWR